MSYKDIYDFEGVIESAVASIFAAQEIVCFTPQGDPQFQKQRPRVEATFVPGQGRQQYLLIGDDFVWNGLNADYDHRRESSFGGALQLDLITDAGMRTHADFRAKVRNVMSTFAMAINGVNLTSHRIQIVRDGQCSSVYKSEEGWWRTTMNYDVEFSIQANAWLALENQ